MNMTTILLYILFIFPIYYLLGLFLVYAIDHLMGLRKFMHYVLLGKFLYFKKERPRRYEITIFMIAWPIWGGLFLLVLFVKMLEELYLQAVKFVVKRATRRKR